MRLIIIHPGVQHAPHLANGALRSGLFEKVTLMTSILFKPGTTSIGALKKRVKPIDAGVEVINHYVYTVLAMFSRALYNWLVVRPQDQSHNNPIYFWQQLFGLLCLPKLFFNRKDALVVCFETTGWPLVKYCKKWGIPVVMDFASISHEKAKTLGINETPYGIKLKVKERAYIDYAFYCSKFCSKSFEGLTSARKDFVLYLGAEGNEIEDKRQKKKDRYSSIQKNNSVKISFIANLEYRKGLDILLESIYAYEYPVFIEVHLIGRIRKTWVEEHMPKNIVNNQVKLVYQPAMSQAGLFAYLQKEAFDLNVQCSRFDSFAMVVPETMMQSIPNVVSPFVGAGELLENEKDGFIMDELTSYCLRRILIQHSFYDEEQKDNMKANVLNKSRQMTWENYYDNLRYVFKNILTD